MNKKSVPTEKDIEKLLERLGADKRSYPKGMLEATRTAYLSHASIVLGKGPHISKGKGPGQGSSPPTSVPITPFMKVILTGLVAANLALATYLAVTAYENWDKVQEFLFGSPPVSETSPAPPELLDQATKPAATPEIAVSPEETVVPTIPPEPTNFSDDPGSSGNNSSDNPQVGTPEPEGNDQPGKHLGQTPHSPGNPPGQDDQDSSNQGKDKKEK